MSALTTNEITSAVRRKILEETNDLVTDSTVLMNANLAYDDLKIKSFTPDQINQATIALTNGVGTLPTGFGTPYGPGYKSLTDRTKFNQKSIADLEDNLDENGFAIVEGQIHVTPDDTSQIIIRYYPSYTALSSDQNPEINEYLHELIIYGAMWRILEDMQNEGLSEYYRQKYNELFKEKNDSLSNYNEDNIDGNQMFNQIRII